MRRYLTTHIYSSEGKLIQGCLKNDAIAQRELYQLYSSKWMGISLRYFSDRFEAEEVLIKAFMKIFTKINQYKNKGSFEGWMRKIVVNEALMHLRETKKLFLHVDMVEASEISSEFPTSSYQEEELLKLIYKLPVGYRTVFNLYAIEGYSHQEIAELLNISISTSKSQLNRARNLLQQYIQTLDKKEDKSTYEI